MSPERWRHIDRVFKSALERPEAERAAFLEAECAGDAVLRREVESLLEHDRDGSFLKSSANEEALTLFADDGAAFVGSRLGNYKILERIGAGGMGVVYAAHDTRLGRKVALKFLLKRFTGDRDRLLRFVREARAASALNHPGIITIHEIGESEGTQYIATEFVEGETLRALMSRGPLPLSETLDIAIQTAAALSAAHEAGVMHRDIKPENLMLRRDGIVKVLDFGLAKLSEERGGAGADTRAATRALDRTSPGVVMGTVTYMSPEQARGLAVDTRTDVFSLGVVLYEMLAGTSPFAGETAGDVVAAILKTEPAPLRDFDQAVPGELERIVGKALAKDREARYQTAKELLADLRRLKKQIELQAELELAAPPGKTAGDNATPVIAARPTLGTTDAAGEIRKNKFGLAAATLLFLLAAFGAGYWFLAERWQSAFSRSAPIGSLAVLPFVNESGNADNEYLSDGMTDALISSLSQLPQLSVKARSSVFRYKGRGVEPRVVGKELSVQAVLLGRVIQRGETLTLSLELVDAQTENVIWSEQYNRRQADIISLQNEIARDVSGKLRFKLSGADEQKMTKNSTANPEAYQLYLKGRFHWNKRTHKDMQRAIEYFQQAIAVEPNYALAYAGLADVYAIMASYSGAPPHETMPLAKEAILKALSLDERSAEAHTALAAIVELYDYEFARAEQEFKRAIELNPNYATAHEFYGLLLINLDRPEESFVEFRRALELDPLSLTTNRFYGQSLIYARRYEEGIAQLKKTLELDANFPTAHHSLAVAYQLQGNHAGHVEEFARYKEAIGELENAALIRESFARGGWQGYLRTMIRENRPPRPVPWRYVKAAFHAELGEKDKAFAELKESYEMRETFFVQVKVDPRFDSLREDPRFLDLLRRARLAP